MKRREVWVIAAMLLLVGAAATAARLGNDGRASAGALALRELSTQGIEDGGAGSEAAEGLTAAEQWAEARTAPGGVIAPGAYSAAFGQLTGLPVTGGSWDEVTDVPYDIDNPEYRDFFSNSGGGQGKQVTGRVTGLAADDSGHVYAGAANGGVWRSSTGGRNWTPIADGIPSLSTGALALDASGALWYATGEANTGGTTYVGNGVYRLADPTTGAFVFPASRVGGTELESTSINAVRFGGSRAWVATSRGIWWHDRSTNTGAWTLSFAPNPSYLPGGANANASNAPFKNWVNDLLVDPNDTSHMIAAVGYRNGDAYNGLYETTNTGATWTRVNTLGGLDLNDIGNVTFAWSAHGERLYLINQSPRRIASGRAFPQTYLDGIYMSKNGSLTGPWTKIASSDKLAQSGSALRGNQGNGYSPGIQAWYNQLLIVDPTNPDHVVAGLEEVYDSLDAGNHWRTIGPYWNFYFSCWSLDAVYDVDGGGNRCPLTTHPDQHSVAIGKVDGAYRLFIGNDGGVYSRPLNGSLNSNGNATDWKSLNDGTMDALQYYSVAVGKVDPGEDHNPPGATAGKVLVSGGLQDNGGSIYLSGDAVQYSNYGGDGGDALVNPDNGCEILQEYTYLALRLTPDCGRQDDPEAFNDISRSTERSVAPPEINARFIAPFAASDTNKNEWIAGGNSVWFQDKGFAIQSGAEWQNVHSWGPAVRVTTALAMSGDTAIAAWCGPCGIIGFTRGLAVGTHHADGSWTWKDSTPQSLVGVPNRYIGGVAVKGDHLYLGLNGFDRRFSEGPGNGLGQVFESTDGGDSWTDIGGGTFPNIPVNSIKAGANGSLIVGTDLGVVIRTSSSAPWTRLGGNLPATVAIDVEFGPDGDVYVATHGRGIWKIASPVAVDSVTAAASTSDAGGAGGASSDATAAKKNGKK